MSRRDLELEKLLLGELPEPAAVKLREELRADPTLAARYEALAASNAQTLAQLPPSAVAREVERRAAALTRPKAPIWRWAALPALATAAALVLVIGPYEVFDTTTTATPIGDSDGNRTKGLDPVLHVFRDRAGIIEELQPGATARAGDQVQLRYASAGAPWGVLLSIDGRGGVTLHSPLAPTAAPRLEPGPHTLPRALELDDAPLFERFIFVTCQSRPDVERVVVAARSLAQQSTARTAPLTLEPGCTHQTSFVLSKESP